MILSLVTAGWQALKWSLYQIGRAGRFVLASTIFHNLNGLFEAGTGKPAPGAGTQTVAGHNHSLAGGYPIFRSMTGGFDTGETVGFLVSGTAAITGESLCDHSPSLFAYINPAVNNQIAGPPEMEAKVFLVLVNDDVVSRDFDLYARNTEDGSVSDTLSVSVGAGVTSSAWHTLTGIPVASGGWQGYDLIASITGSGVNRSMSATSFIPAETSATVAASSGNKYDSATATTRP